MRQAEAEINEVTRGCFSLERLGKIRDKFVISRQRNFCKVVKR